MRLVSAAATLFCLFGGVAINTNDSSAASDSGATVAVQIGDSIGSGEGGRWSGNSLEHSGDRAGTDRAYLSGPGGGLFDPERIYPGSYDNGCHRSDVSPIMSADLPVEERVNLSCSGARTFHILQARSGGHGYQGEMPQGDHLRAIARDKRVRLIAISAGANDLGFQSVMQSCTTRFAAGREPCKPGAEEDVKQNLPEVMRRMTALIKDLRSIMSDEGYAEDDYRIILQAYASVLPRSTDMRYPEKGLVRLTTGGCPMWDVDLDWANDHVLNAFDDSLRAVAGSNQVELLDLRDALRGHELCSRKASQADEESPASPKTSEWVRFLTVRQGHVRESLHPNAYGQLASGKCLSLMYSKPRGHYSCTNTPGRDYNAMQLRRLPVFSE